MHSDRWRWNKPLTQGGEDGGKESTTIKIEGDTKHCVQQSIIRTQFQKGKGKKKSSTKTCCCVRRSRSSGMHYWWSIDCSASSVSSIRSPRSLRSLHLQHAGLKDNPYIDHTIMPLPVEYCGLREESVGFDPVEMSYMK